MNLLFVEIGSPYSIDLAKALHAKGLRVSHITSDKDDRALDLFCSDLKSARIKGQHLYKSEDIYARYKEYLEALSAETLHQFSSIERDFWILTDRTNYKSVPFRKRKTLFYDLIRFWIGYLKAENIEAVYFPYTPHTGWELVLMQACKVLGLKYCYLSHTAINNRSIFRTDYTDIEKVPENYLNDWSAEQIKQDLDQELLKDFEEDSVVTNVIKLENDLFQKQGGINSSPKDYKNLLMEKRTISFLNLLKISLRHYLKRKPHFYFPLAMDAKTSPLKWLAAIRSHKKAARKLKKFYANNAKALDYSVPYIYFPLHLQPELTSQPEAGIFEDNLIALETILEALPEGWKVFVKENPRQYDPTINTVSALHYRDIEDFKRFCHYDQVCLVPQDEPTTKLIENAKVTATLTGTAGWESLEARKICITFGKPWYSACRSVHICRSSEEILKAIKDNKTQDGVYLDILKYLHFYQEKLVIATLHAPSDVSYNSRPYEELLDKQSNYLSRFLMEDTTANAIPKAV